MKKIEQTTTLSAPLTAESEIKCKNHLLQNLEEVARRTMLLLFLLDKSGSMKGKKIGELNYAMKDVPNIINDIANKSPNADIKIVVGTFASDFDWITPNPLTPEEFKKTWKELTPDGMTSLGACLKEVNKKLSRKGFLGENPLGYLKSGIIFLGDGEPTDDWKTALKELKENNWYKNAIKVAFAVGDDANKEVLAELCGTSEAVISIKEPEKLHEYIKFVTATVSQTGTMCDVTKDNQQAVNEALQNYADEEDGFTVVDEPVVDDDQF